MKFGMVIRKTGEVIEIEASSQEEAHGLYSGPYKRYIGVSMFLEIKGISIGYPVY
jgi:hypothetical protein